MPIGYHRSGKPQVWNGSGMASLTPEQRSKAMEAASKRARAYNNGWPPSVQKEGVPHTYHLATIEWDRRIKAARQKKEGKNEHS